MRLSATLTPLGKIYDGFGETELRGLLQEFARLRDNDPLFYGPRIDTIKTILLSRNANVDAPAPLLEQVPS